MIDTHFHGHARRGISLLEILAGIVIAVAITVVSM